MNISVEYLNPFQKITLDKSVKREELANVAHLFSEMIGLDLCAVGDISNSLKLKLD